MDGWLPGTLGRVGVGWGVKGKRRGYKKGSRKDVPGDGSDSNVNCVMFWL